MISILYPVLDILWDNGIIRFLNENFDVGWGEEIFDNKRSTWFSPQRIV